MTLDQLRSDLSAYLARRTPEQFAQLIGLPVALTGGWASRLYTFTLQQNEFADALAATLVLKMYEPNARGCEHATREWRALTHLRAANYPVPSIVIFEPDARHLGHPFIVMDHIAGDSLWHSFEVADPATRVRLTQSFVAELVALHAVDPLLLEPAATSAGPYSYIGQELEQLRRDGADSPHVMSAEIVQWLEQRKQAVPCQRPAILHRDYHPWNVLVDTTENLWVIDWDWRIGDARFDLAWTCTLMQRSGFDAFSSAVRDEYGRQGGRSLDEFAYFEVLTTVRWLLNVLPSVEPDAPSDAAARAEFRAFLVDPVRQAQTLLQERTGINVNVRI